MRCISKNALPKFLKADQIYLFKKNIILVKLLRTKITKITPYASPDFNRTWKSMYPLSSLWYCTFPM